MKDHMERVYPTKNDMNFNYFKNLEEIFAYHSLFFKFHC